MIYHPYGVFDNSPKEYKTIQALPLAAAMGAEVTGVNLAEISDETSTELRDALYRHKMVFFRNQDISHADHEALTRRFGAFGKDAYTGRSRGV